MNSHIISRRKRAIVASLALLASLALSPTTQHQASARVPARVDLKAAKRAAKSNNAFGLRLLRKLATKNKAKNIFISPYSLSLALSMTMAGAKEKTLQELKQLLAVVGQEAQHHKALFALDAWLRQDRDRYKYKLNVANRIWVESSTPAKPAFLNTVKQHYGAGVKQVNFIKQHKKIREEINLWVKGKTQGMIPKLLPSGSLDVYTRMVLTNAIFFKRTWLAKFQKRHTKLHPFYGPKGKKQVMMMRQRGGFSHAYIKGGQVLALPYKGRSVSMVIFLPNKKNKDWRQKWLNPTFVRKSIRRMYRTNIRVFLPRMKLSSGYKLKQTFAKMGVHTAFRKSANFRRMLVNKGMNSDVKIDEVYHKGALEVDEKGTKAAAATAVVMKTKTSGIAPRIKSFRVDRPFLMLLRERKTGAYLFTGIITKPQ